MHQRESAGGGRRKEVGPGTLADTVREQRKALGLTQAQLAGRIGHGKRQSHISEIERGQIKQPRRESFVALAKALELEEAELLARSGYPNIEAYLAALPPLPPDLGPDGERLVEVFDLLGDDDRMALRRYAEFLAFGAAPTTLLTGDDADLAERVQALPPDIQQSLRTAVERIVANYEGNRDAAGEAGRIPPCASLS